MTSSIFFLYLIFNIDASKEIWLNFASNWSRVCIHISLFLWMNSVPNAIYLHVTKMLVMSKCENSAREFM